MLGESPFGPVNKAIGAQRRAVQVVHATREGTAIVPKKALLGHAIIVGIDEPPDLWRGAHPDLVAHQTDTLRQHQLVGKNSPGVEDAIAIGVSQAQHAVRFLDSLGCGGFVGAGRLGHEQPAPGIEHGADGPLHQGGSSHLNDGEAVRHGELVSTQGNGFGGPSHGRLTTEKQHGKEEHGG